jgi:predicted ribonuclease YlaK
MLEDRKYAPLSRMTFGLVGQDLVLDEFYRSIAMHKLAHPDIPLVFILCGPSGHGKTLFARKSTCIFARKASRKL